MFLAFALLSPLAAADLDCLTAVEQVDPGYVTSDRFADFVLGPADLSVANHQLSALARYTEWSRKAKKWVLERSGATRDRADVYERLLHEVVRRADALSEKSGDDIKSWGYRRITLRSGVEVFVGSKGYFFEINPDGNCYKGKFPKKDGGTPVKFLDENWNPPYGTDGTPILDLFESREKDSAANYKD